ncbi:hypothetical protein PE067_06355 [Paracoccus sp. DMF-8]|nr:hypothetical protein [Paracoccus sp. DMF-8]MDF3605800.1 hypothetical protein [Paracoccus sp. DMF-8]
MTFGDHGPTVTIGRDLHAMFGDNHRDVFGGTGMAADRNRKFGAKAR